MVFPEGDYVPTRHQSPQTVPLVAGAITSPTKEVLVGIWNEFGIYIVNRSKLGS